MVSRGLSERSEETLNEGSLSNAVREGIDGSLSNAVREGHDTGSPSVKRGDIDQLAP